MSAREDYLLGIDAVLESFQEIVPSFSREGDAPVLDQERALAEVEEIARGHVPTGSALKPWDEGSAIPSSMAPAREVSAKTISSELPGVSDEAWTRFVTAMKTAQPNAVSASNAFGAFEMKPKRLADLGVMENLRCARSPAGRMAWHGDFVKPLTQRAFLESPKAQYAAFVGSTIAYVKAIHEGRIPKPEGGHPEGATLSGILAILHKCGPSGLRTWNDEENRFPATVALYERANGIF